VIRAVTFDFWGTLYDDGPALPRRRRRRVGYAAGHLMGAGVAERQLEYAFEIVSRDIEHLRVTRHVSLAAEEVGRRVARVVGVTLDAEKATRLGDLISSAGREEPPVPIDGAREALSALHGRVKTAIICDTGLTLGHDLYAIMEADGIAQLLDHFTFSNQTGTTKPEVRQFHYTLHRLGFRPDQAVHVGDLESTDVAGAKAAGLRAIRVVGPGQDPATQADASVAGVAEVLDVLKAWGLEA